MSPSEFGTDTHWTIEAVNKHSDGADDNAVDAAAASSEHDGEEDDDDDDDGDVPFEPASDVDETDV